MSNLIQLVVSGLALGAVYALIALGFVVIYRASQVFNFAQGELLIHRTARLDIVQKTINIVEGPVYSGDADEASIDHYGVGLLHDHLAFVDIGFSHHGDWTASLLHQLPGAVTSP